MQLCAKRFDDLTGTIFSGRHQSITVWISSLYLLGLNVSNAQIAQELGLCASDSQRMAEQLRQQSLGTTPLCSWQTRLNAMMLLWWRDIKAFQPRLKTVIRVEIV